MKQSLLKEIIELKKQKKEFAILTDISNATSEIYTVDKPLSVNFNKNLSEIKKYYDEKKNGVIENTNIFIETYILPINVIIVGAVHIAQYLVDFAKSLNFEISIIDPRGYFASEQRFPNIKVINKWPNEAFQEIKTNTNTALIALLMILK